MHSPSETTTTTPLPSSIADQIGFLLSKAHLRIHNRANEALEPLGLNVKHYGLLTVIVHEGPIPQGRLGEIMRIDRTTMVGFIDDLERHGYVDRTRNPQDRREYALVATGAGKRLQRSAAAVMRKVQGETLSPLTATERRELQRMLRVLVEAG